MYAPYSAARRTPFRPPSTFCFPTAPSRSTSAHTVCVSGQPVQLTLKEYQLLTLLMKNQGAVLTRDVLLENIWGYGSESETRTVDVHIRTLRQKLGDGGALIETVRGVGYRMGGNA